MRRVMITWGAALVAVVLAVGSVTAAGSLWKAPPFSSIGIKTIENIDATFVDADTDATVLSVFVETGSKSTACLATPTEESNVAGDMPGLASLFCAQRSVTIDGVVTHGLYLHIFLDGPMGTGAFTVNVYQEGARFYGSPKHCLFEGC